MKTTVILFFGLLLSCEASRACICATVSDARLYYTYANIQTATVQEIEINELGQWTVQLSNVIPLKGNISSDKVFIGIQLTSCSVSIKEGQSWVFFFSELDSFSQIVVSYCSPSRDLYYRPFSLEYVFKYQYFDHYALPEDTFYSYTKLVHHYLDSALAGLNPSKNIDTLVQLDYFISNTGVIQSVRVNQAFVKSGDNFINVLYPENALIDQVRNRLTGMKVPVFHYFGYPLNVVVWHRCP